MKKVSVLIFLLLPLVFLLVGCDSPSDSDSGDDDVYITMQYYDFQVSDINFNVTLGDNSYTSFTGTYLIYSENWADYEDGLSLHFMAPDSSGSMAEPGYGWLVLKIQKSVMSAGVYTLDSADPNYQLSSEGQVKLWYKDAEGAKHPASGELVINSLSWSFSDDDEASLSINLSLDSVNLLTGVSGGTLQRAITDSGSVTGTFNGQASISEGSSGALVGTKWKGTFVYYPAITFEETLSFVSATSCVGTTVGDGQTLTTNMTYTYNPATQTGTLSADSTLPFSISGDVLTFNNVNYYKQ